MNTRIAQIVVKNSQSYTGIVFSSETLKYQFVKLPCLFRDQAELLLKREFPGIQIAKSEAEFVQLLNQITDEGE